MSLNELLDREDFDANGIWEPMPKGVGGEVLVASAGNPQYVEKLRMLQARWRKRNSHPEAKPIPEAENEQLWRESIVGTLLLSWRDVPMEPLKPEIAAKVGGPPPLPPDKGVLPWSEGNALWLLNASTKFRVHMVNRVMDDEEFELRHREAIAGNSPSPSAGTTGGSTDQTTTG